MRFGLQLFTDFTAPTADLWRQIRAQAEMAERVGFDGIFVETNISWRRLDPLSVLAAVASVTSRVLVGTNIITLPLYAPLQVAEAIATADHVSGGRAILGVASGWRRDEFRAAGVPYEERVGRTYESLRLIRALWTEPRVTAAGRYYQLEDVPLELKPLQRPHPPIWLAAHARPAIERAGRHGLPWIEGPRTALPTLAEKVGWYRAALAAAGHELGELPLLREGFVAETAAEARRAMEAPLLDKYAEYARQAGLAIDPATVSFDRLARDRFIFGSADDCREQVDRYAQLGVTWLVLRMQYRSSDPRRCLESIRRFGNEVVRPFGTGDGAP